MDDFYSVYLDDILIYLDGNMEEHREYIKKVLSKLHDAGLYLDLRKCEFECTKTKYLRFIVRAGEGIKIDPEKVEAILK